MYRYCLEQIWLRLKLQKLKVKAQNTHKPGTSLGIFLQMIASLNTVPPRIFLMVPLGDLYIFFSLNSEKKN